MPEHSFVVDQEWRKNPWGSTTMFLLFVHEFMIIEHYHDQ